jgi:hypothetical protein
MPSRDSKTLTFRISGAPLERLGREAAELRISRSERARQILLAALGDALQREILGSTRETLTAVHGLREDVARTLVSVIDTLQTDPGTGVKRHSTEQVREMVGRYLRRP